MHMQLNEKLAKLRAMSGMTLAEVAENMPGSVTRVAVGFWESDDPNQRTEPRKANRSALAKLYGLSVSELMASEDNTSLSKYAVESNISPVDKANVLTKNIPVIKLTDIAVFIRNGTYTDIPIVEWMSVVLTEDENCIALKVTGTSMYQAGKEPSYPDGCVVLCYQSLVDDVQIGDGVIAQISSSGQHVFKLYDEVDGKPVLMPVNDKYPPITDEFTLIGVIDKTVINRRQR